MVPKSALVDVSGLECFFGTETLLGVPAEELEEKFSRLVVLRDARQSRNVSRLHCTVLRHVAASCLAGCADFVWSWSTKDVDDFVNLFERILGQEENLSMKELSINASDRPHVDGEIVVACAEK